MVYPTSRQLQDNSTLFPADWNPPQVLMFRDLTTPPSLCNYVCVCLSQQKAGNLQMIISESLVDAGGCLMPKKFMPGHAALLLVISLDEVVGTGFGTKDSLSVDIIPGQAVPIIIQSAPCLRLRRPFGLHGNKEKRSRKRRVFLLLKDVSLGCFGGPGSDVHSLGYAGCVYRSLTRIVSQLFTTNS